jgi:hypothetical protein
MAVPRGPKACLVGPWEAEMENIGSARTDGFHLGYGSALLSPCAIATGVQVEQAGWSPLGRCGICDCTVDRAQLDRTTCEEPKRKFIGCLTTPDEGGNGLAALNKMRILTVIKEVGVGDANESWRELQRGVFHAPRLPLYATSDNDTSPRTKWKRFRGTLLTQYRCGIANLGGFLAPSRGIEDAPPECPNRLEVKLQSADSGLNPNRNFISAPESQETENPIPHLGPKSYINIRVPEPSLQRIQNLTTGGAGGKL